MTFSWKSMALEDYVAYQRLMGVKVVPVEGHYWREVRPFFYRPLLTSQVVPSGSSPKPPGSKYFGTQYAVTPDRNANSYLIQLSFENHRGYSLESLHRNWKRKVRLAAKNLVIRPILTASEFNQQAHPVYLSFYERTRYQVRMERREPAYFSNWANALYQIPNLLILGGFRNDELGGVSVTLLLDRTLIYASFFCDDESLKLHLPDLMLHAVRESASASPEIDDIFVSMYKGGVGLDAFYLNRGAKIVRQPAQLELNPLVKFILQHLLPKQYAQLLGHVPEQPIPPVAGETPPKNSPGSPAQPNCSDHSGPKKSGSSGIVPTPRD